MTVNGPVLFYAPMKPADHAVPSGDRAMARLFVRLLDRLEYASTIASTLRTHDAAGIEDRQRAFQDAAGHEVDRLIALHAGRPGGKRPAFWFTYHVYYKAPDLIGPRVARALSIPYIVAEGSRAPKRAAGRWAIGHGFAEAALDAADLILILNPDDRAMLEAVRPPGQRLVSLPPFIDPALWPAAGTPPAQRTAAPVRLVSVAMMREGDKLASYAMLADALAACMRHEWTLTIIGDGPARPAVEALFRHCSQRVRFAGAIEDPVLLGEAYRDADLLAWPAINEAFGMVFLEAALHGCPAVAGDFGGVGSMVWDNETGLLASPGDTAAFADALDRLLTTPGLRRRLGKQARLFASGERSIAAAEAICRPILAELAAAP